MSALKTYAHSFWDIKNSAGNCRTLENMLIKFASEPTDERGDEIVTQLRRVCEMLGFGIHPIEIEEKT